MVGRPCQGVRVLRAHLHQLFLGALYPHDSTVFRRETLTAAQDRSAIEKEPYFLAAGESRPQPALASLLERQRQGVVGAGS